MQANRAYAFLVAGVIFLLDQLSKYWVTYESDSVHPKKPKNYFNLRFQAKNGKENKRFLFHLHVYFLKSG